MVRCLTGMPNCNCKRGGRYERKAVVWVDEEGETLGNYLSPQQAATKLGILLSEVRTKRASLANVVLLIISRHTLIRWRLS